MIRVGVFHYFWEHWLGKSRTGDYSCNNCIQCDWIVSNKLQRQLSQVARNHSFTNQTLPSHRTPLVTVALYNINALWENQETAEPPLCHFQGANLTLYDTLEPSFRYRTLFEKTDQHFDGYSSTSPNSTAQRVYTDVYLNETELFPLRNFSTLMKGGSYIASNCKHFNNHLENIIRALRKMRFRIDGLGNCLRSEDVSLEGINLNSFRRSRNGGPTKLEILNYYAFNMAFENTIEFGYVTEKPFDPLVAGSVSVYLGDAKHLKTLIPHPKAVIFLDDFPNLSDLANHLQYLLSNETAYEEHRAWRKNFSYFSNIKGKDLLERTWQCRLCEWAAEQYRLYQMEFVHYHIKTVPSKISNKRCALETHNFPTS